MVQASSSLSVLEVTGIWEYGNMGIWEWEINDLKRPPSIVSFPIFPLC